MKNSLLAVLFTASFLFAPCFLFAQQTELDSLLNLLSRNNSVQDTFKVSLLNKIAWRSKKINPGSAEAFSTQALTLAKKLNDKPGIANSYYHLGTIKQDKGLFDESLKELQIALDISKSIKDSLLIAKSFQGIGLTYKNTGEYEQGVQFYFKALSIYEKLNEKASAGKILNNIGNIYLATGTHYRALSCYTRGLKLFKEINDKPLIGFILNNVGSVYVELAKYEQAKYYFLESVKIKKPLDDKIGLSITYLNLGNIYQRTEKYEESTLYYKQALELQQQINDVNGIVNSYIGLGNNYYNTAIQDYDVEKFKKAAEYAHQALSMSREINNIIQIRDVLKLLGITYYQLNQHKKAYDYYLEYSEKKDSLLNEKNYYSLLEVESKYETEKKEAQIKSLQQEKAIQQLALNKKQFQNYAYMSGAALLLVISGLLFWLYKLKQKTNKQLQSANLTLEEKNIEIRYQQEKSELKALLAQMNPHFIFNALNSIQGYIATNEKEKANEYLTTFGKLVRAILENSNKSYITIQEELEALEMYTRLEGERAEDRFKFVTDIDPAIDIHNLQIPPMLLQPHIENAIWHGIMPANGKGVITLAMKLMENKIHCTIEDNGIGIKQASELKKLNPVANGRKSNGVEITRQRLEAIWQKKQQQHTISIADREEIEEQNGTRVEFFMPYEF